MKTNKILNETPNKNNQRRNHFYDKIPLSLTNLSDDVRRLISYFCHFTLKQIKEGKSDYFKPMPRNFGKAMFRVHYHRHLNYCLKNKILETKVYGINHETKTAITYSEKANLCKSYALDSELIDELKNGRYSRNPISSPRYFPKGISASQVGVVNVKLNGKRVHTTAELEILEKLKRNYTQVKFTVAEQWQDNFNKPTEKNDLNEYFDDLRVIKSLQKGDFNISVGEKNGRIYSPLITMRSGFRQFVRIDGKRLWNIDMKCFHPFLLASFIKDPKRKAEYAAFLQSNDIYNQFIDGDNDRNEVKLQFQIFLAFESRYLGSMRCSGKPKEIYLWFKKNFPEINTAKHHIFKTGSNFQLELQRRESEIFVQTVFRNSEFWMVPAHDGAFTVEDHLIEAKKKIKEACEGYLGFDVQTEVALA